MYKITIATAALLAALAFGSHVSAVLAAPMGPALAAVQEGGDDLVIKVNRRRNRNIAVGVLAGAAAVAIIAGAANAQSQQRRYVRSRSSGTNVNGGRSNSCRSLRNLCERSNPDHPRCYDYDYRCLGYGG